MVQTSISQIKTYIDDFKSLNLAETISGFFPDLIDLQNLHFNRFSATEFIELTERFFRQLENEIDNGNGLILPLYFTNPEFGQADLPTQINGLLSSIKTGQFQSAEAPLSWLITYQLQNGFYNKSQYKLHPFNISELKKGQTVIDLQIESLNKLKIKYENGIELLENEKNQLANFKTQKENELLQILNNLESSNTNNNAIQNILNSASQSLTKIEAILGETGKESTKIQAIASDMDKVVAKTKTDFAELLSSLQESEGKYQNLYNDFAEKLEFVQSKFDYFTERNTYLDNLIGREVGASLFETFKQRKTELSNPLKFWRIAIGSMTAITLFGIFAIFTNFFGLIAGSTTPILNWEVIVVNAIKSSPFIFLLYYTISQYNKERNFQEEYAFKSAVALTINAYADVLKDNKMKDELILKAVFGIYRSPIYSKIKANKEVTSVLDLLKEGLDKMSDVISKK
jgi:hypothetical protein